MKLRKFEISKARDLDAVDAQVERVARLADAIEAVCTEILVRLDWLERDVEALKKREGL